MNLRYRKYDRRSDTRKTKKIKLKSSILIYLCSLLFDWLSLLYSLYVQCIYGYLKRFYKTCHLTETEWSVSNDGYVCIHYGIYLN